MATREPQQTDPHIQTHDPRTGEPLVTASPAATIIVFRDCPDGGAPELLMVERSSHMVFAGGAVVFPGGRVDDRLLGRRIDGRHARFDEAHAAVAHDRELRVVAIVGNIHPDQAGGFDHVLPLGTAISLPSMLTVTRSGLAGWIIAKRRQDAEDRKPESAAGCLDCAAVGAQQAANFVQPGSELTNVTVAQVANQDKVVTTLLERALGGVHEALLVGKAGLLEPSAMLAGMEIAALRSCEDRP